jgi:hypothetical protein
MKASESQKKCVPRLTAGKFIKFFCVFLRMETNPAFGLNVSIREEMAVS